MTLIWAGFLLGCAFGVAARLSRFCLLRGLRQQLQRASPDNDGAPALQAFALALAVALIASQALAFGGQIDLNTAQVVRANFSVTGTLLGGLLFGAGMVLARSCGARALVLLAGGNLRALVTLLCLGLAAQATLTGVLVPVLEQFAAPPNGIYAVFPQRKHLPLRVRLWIDYLKQQFAHLPFAHQPSVKPG